MIRNLRTAKLFLFVLITLLSSGIGFSQNYMLFEKDRTMNFARLKTTGADSLYYFMKITDETTDGSDTTWYFNQQFRSPVPADPECFLVNNDTVLLGDRVLIMNDTDRTHVLFNYRNDSIFIKTQIAIGNTWKVYKWPNGSYVKATVINKLEGELLPGVIDSFYRIKLNVYTLGGTMLTDTFPNETKMDISKSVGIVEFFNFHIFPNPGDSIARVLRGLANPDRGIVDVDAQTAFEFETGYEFHYREETAPDTETGADLRIRAWKYFVMEKSVDDIGATYTMERVLFDTLYTDGVPSSQIIWDTVTVHYDFADYAFLDTIEFNLLQQTIDGYSDWNMVDTIYNGVAHKTVYDWYTYDDATKCISNPDGIANPVQIYGDGLGTMLYIDSTDAENYYKLEMVYFKQGLTTYGTPYDFSALDNAIVSYTATRQLHIYPNPATDILYLQELSETSASITITDIYGRVLLTTDNYANGLNIQSLPAGYYRLIAATVSDVYAGAFVKY